MKNKEVKESGSIRYLKHGKASQGAIKIDSDEVVSPFVREAVNQVNDLPENANVIMLGGGTYTIPRYIRKDISMAIVEIDPHMEILAKQHFKWEGNDQILTIIDDAKKFISSRYKTMECHDMVIVDLFDGEKVPEFAMTSKFYKQLSHITDRVLVNEYSVDIEAPYFDYGKSFKSIVGVTHDVYNYWVTRLLFNLGG